MKIQFFLIILFIAPICAMGDYNDHETQIYQASEVPTIEFETNATIINADGIPCILPETALSVITEITNPSADPIYNVKLKVISDSLYYE